MFLIEHKDLMLLALLDLYNWRKDKWKGEFMNEFAIEWTKDRDTATVTAPSGTALCNKLKRFHEEKPDEVTDFIENTDGSICCHVPVKWVKVSPPRKMTDAQIEAARERMNEMHSNNRFTKD